MISAAILTRNSPELTTLRINELVSHRIPEEEIIVVDAGSDEELVHDQTTIRVDHLEVLEMGLRFCRGMNLAIDHWLHHSKTAWILLLPADYEIVAVDLRRLEAALESVPEAAIVAPLQSNSEQAELIGGADLKLAWQFDDGPLLVARKLWEERERAPKSTFQLFSHDNFRSILYGLEATLAALFLGFCPAITSAVETREDESYLDRHQVKLRTESREDHLLKARIEMEQRYSVRFGTADPWYLVRAVDSLFLKFLQENPHLKDLAVKELVR